MHRSGICTGVSTLCLNETTTTAKFFLVFRVSLISDLMKCVCISLTALSHVVCNYLLNGDYINQLLINFINFSIITLKKQFFSCYKCAVSLFSTRPPSVNIKQELYVSAAHFQDGLNQNVLILWLVFVLEKEIVGFRTQKLFLRFKLSFDRAYHQGWIRWPWSIL